MIDSIDLLQGIGGDSAGTAGPHARRRAALALGCAVAALLTAIAGVWCFAVPPIIAAIALFHAGEAAPAPTGS